MNLFRRSPLHRLTIEIRDSSVLVLILACLPAVLGNFDLLSLGSFIPYALVAVSLSLVWGYCGILCLGQAAFFGLGSYGAALGSEHWGGLSGFLEGAALGLIAAAFVAYLVGRIAFTARMNPFYATIITFVLGVLMQQLLIQFTSFTGGANGIILSTLVLPASTVSQYYVLLAAFAALLVPLVLLVTSEAGIYVVGCRDNERRLRFLGSDVDMIKRRTLMLGSVVAAGAGVMYTAANQQAVPDNVGFQFSTQILVWTAIGGRRSLPGAALGALVVNLATEHLSSGFLSYWNIMLGAGFIVAVMFVPDGIYSLWRRALARFEPRVTRPFIPAQGNRLDRTTNGGLVHADQLTAKFGAFTALDLERIELRAGELCALIGPNGAGKTTLIEVLSGSLAPTRGAAYLGDARLTGKSVNAIAGLGVRRKFQAPNVFESLSVLENVRLGTTATAPSWCLPFHRSRTVRLAQDVLELLEASGLADHPDRTAGSLSHGEKQWLELCVLLAGSPRVILLDEPTAGLSLAERERVGQLLCELAAAGSTLLLVEHDFDFVRRVADRVMVMHQGQLVADGTTEEIANNDLVRSIYLGVAT